MTGLSDKPHDALMERFAAPLKARARRVSTAEDIERTRRSGAVQRPAARWGRDRIGIGLLKALRACRSILFSRCPSPAEAVPSLSNHLVVCEQGEPLAEVIAANYAYALRAGLCLIPEIGRELTDELLEGFYSLYDDRSVSPTEALERLQDRFLNLTGMLPVSQGGSVTFITGGLPLGISIPQVPSTHLFKYPDLGIAMINGLAAEQADRPGIGFVALVDPETTEAQEIAAAERLLPPRGAFIRTYFGAGANVREVTRMMELLPYDLMIVATHCGDVSGFRWTYEFKDSDGIDRVLVVDVAIGVGRTDEEHMLNVTQFTRFISLDGVDWNDPEKDKKLYVGRAILDFLERTRPKNSTLQPVKKETVSRVVGSSALKLHDHNLIVLPKAVADEGTPIIINNACASWHRLAANFIFGGRAGLCRHSVPGHNVRGAGCHRQAARQAWGKAASGRLVVRAARSVWRRPAASLYCHGRLSAEAAHQEARRHRTHAGAPLPRACWLEKALAAVDPNDSARMRTVRENIAYYERELAHFRELARRHTFDVPS